MIGPVVLSVFPLMALAMALRGIAGWAEIGDKRFAGALAGGGLGAAGFAILIVRAMLGASPSPDAGLVLARIVSVAIAPPVEELLKGGVILMIALLLPWDARRTGLVVGAITGLAFAMTENVHFFVRAGDALAARGVATSLQVGPFSIAVPPMLSGPLLAYVLERLLLVSVMHAVAGSWVGGALTGGRPASRIAPALGALGAGVAMHAAWNAMAWLQLSLPVAKFAGGLFIYACATGTCVLYVLSPRGATPPAP